ncbi:methionine adenosyltransferase [Clostridium botulinum]|uniref:S-adenosylmethionine synthase n=1 Tax=Clostridium botulinum TaxID=1491 RepID=A0A6M0SR35_CLOBO|nr:methionine adenosyltransferase [Clostridium botulinum]
MHMKRILLTSESVTEGHPDKICDQISDAVLDECMRQDPQSRVACETSVTKDFVLVMGEITTNAKLNIEKIVRNVIKDIGYNNFEYGFDYKSCKIKVLIESQSKDIAIGVNESLESKRKNFKGKKQLGAGDQGMVFGYASNETEDYMPYSIDLAHKLAKQLSKVRKKGLLTYLRPDGKTQVTVEYDKNEIPIRLDTVVLSAQHDPNVTQEQIYKDIKKHIFEPIIPQNMVDAKTKFLINPTGRFVIGGPYGDSGLTGRKIIVDSYGGYAHHGGGAFSGKDCTKVDRSAAYAARYVAKNIVAAGLASKCEIQISYAIGIAEPIALDINTFGTGKVSKDIFISAINQVFDLTPSGIIEMLNLRNPIYSKTSAYGHFGDNTKELAWEQTDKVNDILKHCIK